MGRFASWNDFRFKEIVERIRSAYLPETLHKEIPQQRDLAKGFDPVAKLKQAARMFNCDLDHFRQVPRITKSDRDNRDLLVFSVWNTGLLTNEEIGRLFGMTYSAVSHIVSSIRLRIKENRELKEKTNQINSLYKM